MSHQRNAVSRRIPVRRHRRPQRRLGRFSKYLARMAGNAVYLLLGVAALALIASIVFAMSSASPTNTVNTDGAAGPSGPPASDITWIPLRSQAPADILAAARSGVLFHESQGGGGDQTPDLSRLGTPVLVQGLRSAGMTPVQVPDFYIVPILDQSGATVAAAELALNPAHSALQEVAIVTYSVPRADGAVAALPASAAIQAVTSDAPATAGQLGQPYLVYFSSSGQAPVQTSQGLWAAGGMLPADPIWLVPAAHAGPYVVGTDGKVYTLSQLPQ